MIAGQPRVTQSSRSCEGGTKISVMMGKIVRGLTVFRNYTIVGLKMITDTQLKLVFVLLFTELTVIPAL